MRNVLVGALCLSLWGHAASGDRNSRDLASTTQGPAGQFGAGAFRLEFATWGVAPPVVVTWSEPQYTRAGMALKLQGTVELDVVVNADGSVGDARLVRGLDARLPYLIADVRRVRGDAVADAVLGMLVNGAIGLDASAIDCVKTWTFTPASILGKPVAAIRATSVVFRLR
jgi:hypothetical protein